MLINSYSRTRESIEPVISLRVSQPQGYRGTRAYLMREPRQLGHLSHVLIWPLAYAFACVLGY
jgi:hypothetical protein